MTLEFYAQLLIGAGVLGLMCATIYICYSATQSNRVMLKRIRKMTVDINRHVRDQETLLLALTQKGKK